jgi:kinesin family protein 11
MVANQDEIFGVLETACANRTVAATLCNERSSRSHSIFTLKIHIKESTPEGEDLVKVGKLNLVDLAGSECVGRSGAKDVRAREASNINKSLLTLGRVITALVDLRGHVPYRDSKLTRLLQESLGGKAKTCVIATVTPSSDSIEETLSTLEYMHSAKRIKNKPQANQRMTKRSLIKDYTEDIEKLRSLLTAARDKNGVFLPQAEFEGMETQITGQEAQIKELEQALEAKETEFSEVSSLFEGVKDELTDAKTEIGGLSSDLASTKIVLESTSAELEETKVEVEETKVLVDAHQATEAVLAEQGHSVREELVQTSDDVSGLFAKVGRKQQVEDKNEAAVEKLTSECAAQVAALSSEIDRYERGQQKQADAVVQSVRAMTSLHANSTSQLGAALEALIEASGASAPSPAETVAAYCTGAGEAIGALMSSVEARSTERIGSMRSSAEAVAAAAAAVRDQLEGQQQVMEAWAQKLSTDLQSNNSAALAFAQQQRAGLGMLGSTVNEGVQHVQGLLVGEDNSLEHTVAAAVDDAKHEQQLQLDKLTADINGLLGAFAAQQTQQLTSTAGKATNLAAQAASAAGDMGKTISKKTEAMVSALESHETQACESNKATLANVSTMVEERAVDADGNQSALIELAKQATDTTDECVDVDEKWTADFSKHATDAKHATETFAAGVAAELEAAAELGADLVARASTSMADAEEAANEAITGGIDATISFIRDEARVGVGALHSKVREFAGEQFGTDVPTGSTPCVRNIPILDKFAKTEAHDVIIKRHRKSKRGLAFASPFASPVAATTALGQQLEAGPATEPAVDDINQEEIKTDAPTTPTAPQQQEPPAPPAQDENTNAPITTSAPTTTAHAPITTSAPTTNAPTTTATLAPTGMATPRRPKISRAASDSDINVQGSFDPKKLKVSELRAELKTRGLDQTGLKPVLVKRLQKAMLQSGASEAPSTPVVNFNLGGGGTPRRSSIPTPRTTRRSSMKAAIPSAMPLAESTNSPMAMPR